MFKRYRPPVKIILVCVRWYCKYAISHRDLAEMMQERGVKVAPSKIMRWVYRYASRLEKRSVGIQAIGLPPGAWTRPTSRSAASGSTCSVLSNRSGSWGVQASHSADTRLSDHEDGIRSYQELLSDAHHPPRSLPHLQTPRKRWSAFQQQALRCLPRTQLNGKTTPEPRSAR